MELAEDTLKIDEHMADKTTLTDTKKRHSYIPPSAIALRCRVMPPPCIKNPYLDGASETDADPFGNRRSKCAGEHRYLVIIFLEVLFPKLTGGCDIGMGRSFSRTCWWRWSITLPHRLS